MPTWFPDGGRLAYSSESGLAWQAADGSGSVTKISENPQAGFPSAFSPDGRHLVVWGQGAGDDLYVLSLGADGRVERQPLLLVAGRNAEISPDGRWMAYDSNESRQFQVYVRPFPDVARGRWQISTEGGTQPVWSRSGRELFYRGPTGAVMAASVDGTRVFAASKPAELFDGPYFNGSAGFLARTYDVSSNGQQFLMIKETAQPSQSSDYFVVVLNWFEELNQRVPRRH
jgi:eukaryotic-like serine/threonine-protein kinase